MTNKQAINILLNEQKCIDRNDGVQCNRECGSCDLVMDVETIREAYSMAISALEERDLPSTNVGDTIYRQVAIDALMAWEEYSVWDEECLKHRGEPYWVAPSDVINQLPSAQPDFDITVKIDKAYDDGYEAGYLQGRHDWGDLDE